MHQQAATKGADGATLQNLGPPDDPVRALVGLLLTGMTSRPLHAFGIVSSIQLLWSQQAIIDRLFKQLEGASRVDVINTLTITLACVCAGVGLGGGIRG